MHTTHCLERVGESGGPKPGDLHLAWVDLTDAETVRAEAVPPEELLEANASAKRVADVMRSPMKAPEPYKWKELAERIYEWEEANPPPVLGAAEELALAGIDRFLVMRQLDWREERVRRLLHKAHSEGLGPTRLAVLSGVSRRTIPGWLRAVR
jgi:hypothetical protein